MHLSLNLITISLLIHISWTQFNSDTYPDPRFDPFGCRIPTVGPICDPSGLLTFDDKKALASRIKQLLAYAATVPNSSPECRFFPGKSLDIIIGLIDKIDMSPAVDIERFTNNLKTRYQFYQDPSLCDLMVLIVNSNNDRQIFTVVGKHTQLTKDVLKTAVEQNIHHFRANRLVMGLQGMAEFITKSYYDVQLFQLRTPLSLLPPIPTFLKNEVNTAITNDAWKTVDELGKSYPITIPRFYSRQSRFGNENEIDGENLMVPVKDESDQLWIDILTQAVARCGNNYDKVARYVQAVIEEAMSLSLRLISDQRYHTIEERMQLMQNDSDTRSRIWNEAKAEFIDQLYQKYFTTIMRKANFRCPARSEAPFIFPVLH
uniref:Uncharacterized protein n=1 Tax=Onchocerca volvulus TaxID=6282 RepID=A0A8R1XLC3_ONCVO